MMTLPPIESHSETDILTQNQPLISGMSSPAWSA